MKVIGMCVVGQGEADKYLPEVIERNLKLCDDIVFVLNNTDDKTKKMLEGFYTITDDREWGFNQYKIKQDAYAKIIKHLNPDWVLTFDADEVFDKQLDYKKITDLCSSKIYDSYNFYFIQHWNDRSHYMPELGFWNVRLFNARSGDGVWEKKPLHCGLAPRWAYLVAWYVPYVVHHYGLMDKGVRQDKIKRYEKYDPKARFMSRWFYDSLKIDNGKPFNYDIIIKQLADEVKAYVPRDKKLMTAEQNVKKFYYVRRVKDGAILDIPEQSLEDTLKQGGFELIDREPVVQGGGAVSTTTTKQQIKPPIVSGDKFNIVSEEEVKEELKNFADKQEAISKNTAPDKVKERQEDSIPVCDICGKVCRSVPGLKSHLKTHDKKKR